jgi:hypothetical protein
MLQELLDHIIRLTTRGADRPCLIFTPLLDVDERFRVTVCATCKFPEPYHLLMRAVELLEAGPDDGAWDAERAGRVEAAVATLENLVLQKAGTRLIFSAINALEAFALEERPASAQEQAAADVVRNVLAAASKVTITDRPLNTALVAASAWLENYELQT